MKHFIQVARLALLSLVVIIGLAIIPLAATLRERAIGWAIVFGAVVYALRSLKSKRAVSPERTRDEQAELAKETIVPMLSELPDLPGLPGDPPQLREEAEPADADVRSV